VLAYHIKDGQQQDAEVFLGLYLDALDEELVELHTYISTHKPALVPSVDEIEGEIQSAWDKTEVGQRGYIPPLFSLVADVFLDT
jgi:hypothetical protein